MGAIMNKKNKKLNTLEKFNKKFINSDISNFFSIRFFIRYFLFFIYLASFAVLFHCDVEVKEEDDKIGANFILTVENKNGNDPEKKKYFISLKKKGSKISEDQLDKLQKEFVDTNTGYNFKGWHENDTHFGNKVTAEKLAQISINETTNFYGKLEILKGFSYSYANSDSFFELDTLRIIWG